MRQLPVWIVVSLLILGGGGLWWMRAQAPVNPTVPPPTLTPNLITVNTPTETMATVSIPDPTLNPTTVALLRVNASGMSALLAEMNDTGKGGDQKPGDKVFTAKFNLNENQVGVFGFQVSATFRGTNRTLSAVQQFVVLAPHTVPVVLPPDPGQVGTDTLQGIDRDGDNVRDDIQRYIILSYPASEKTRTALFQMAKAAQSLVLQPLDPQASRRNMADFIRGQNCLSASTSEEIAIVLKRSLREEMLNTSARSKAWQDADVHNWGNVGTTLATTPELKSECNLNPDGMVN